MKMGDVNEVFQRRGAEGVTALKREATPYRPRRAPRNLEEPSADTDTPPPSTRGVASIAVRHPEYLVNDAVTDALRDDVELYQRAGALVRVVHAGTSPLVERQVGAPRIERIEAPTLRDRISRRADFFRKQKPKKGQSVGDWAACAVPKDAVAAVLARGSWPCRYLEGVVAEPVIRPNGSVLAVPGYDPSTALLLSEHGIDPVPDQPTREEVQAAVRALVEVVADFPLEGPEHVSAWVALVLTAFARFAIVGPTPLFLIEANTRGAGKSLLADTASVLTTGRKAARTTFPGIEHESEFRKVVTATALAGDRMVLLDNVATKLGGTALDSMLTGTTWRDRVLGRSEMTPDLPLTTIWVATANNCTLSDDTTRRVLPIRLESPLEHPEERVEFSIADIKGYVLRERPRLAAAALTVLRGYFAAGRPQSGLTPWGSYEGWCAVVREAIVFAGLPDPCRTREGISASTTEAESLHALVHGLQEFVKSDPSTVASNGWFKAAHLVERLKKTTDPLTAGPSRDRFESGDDERSGAAEEAPFALLREGLDALLDGKRLDAGSVGRLLRDHRNRRIDGLTIRRENATTAVTRWTIRHDHNGEKP